jgi:plasmid stabilization system protein ParE
MAEGVRKMVTRKYAYLIYYMDETEDEIISLNVKHEARERGHSDI